MPAAPQSASKVWTRPSWLKNQTGSLGIFLARPISQSEVLHPPTIHKICLESQRLSHFKHKKSTFSMIMFGLNKPCTIISWGKKKKILNSTPNSTSLSWVEAVGSKRAVNSYVFSIMKEEKWINVFDFLTATRKHLLRKGRSADAAVLYCVLRNQIPVRTHERDGEQ